MTPSNNAFLFNKYSFIETTNFDALAKNSEREIFNFLLTENTNNQNIF